MRIKTLPDGVMICDDDGVEVLKVQALCCSRKTDRGKWVAVRLLSQSDVVDVSASKRRIRTHKLDTVNAKRVRKANP